jgi:hypothetical protein
MALAEAGCDVVGLDLTEAPLAIAEQTRRARGLTALRFQIGDAEHLPFDAQSFQQLEVESVATYSLTQAAERWLANAQTPTERAEVVRTMIEQDRLRNLSGMYPRLRQGESYFEQRVALFVCRKLALVSR